MTRSVVGICPGVLIERFRFVSGFFAWQYSDTSSKNTGQQYKPLWLELIHDYT